MTASRAPECLSDERVTELAEGLLSADELAQADRHLADCAFCRAAVADLAQVLPEESHRPSARDQLPPSPASESTYEIGRELARGGMGRILEAWDLRHRRPVAIKVLLRHGPAAAARFLREVRITARLQHPAIIPLYEAGLWPNDEPYFVMKLVAGRSLGDVVDDAPSLEERLALLPNVIAITDALAYAHGQRIVHRDLKPSNVLVGAFGETVVIDWGLAKDLDARDGADDAAGAAGADPALTIAGRALGTPSYMAPEQARGEPVDARADVYALGALLYYVLAGKPPFEGRSSDELLTRVLAGPPRPLSKQVPGLAPDLATIVEKAMAREPADRYASAQAMASDLKRFAEGRLVSAHRYSLAALARRWVARHRAVFAMAVTLVVGLSAVGALSVRRVVRERDRADQLKAVAEERERVAVARRDASEGLTEYMTTELRARLAELGRLDLMSGVAGELDGYYRTMAPYDQAETQASLAHRAATFDLMGEVQSAKNDPAVARDWATRALVLRQMALGLWPEDRESRAHLAESYLRLAAAELELTHDDDALLAARCAAGIASALVSEEPSSPRFQLLLASAEHELAEQLASRGGDSEDELKTRERARDILEALVAARPDDTEVGKRLADELIWLGNDEVRFGRYEDALRHTRRALALLDELVARHPNDTGIELLAAQAMAKLGVVEMGTGDFDDSVDHFQDCVATVDRLAAHDPANSLWRHRLAQCLGGIGEVGVMAGRFPEARIAQERSMALSRAAADEHPEGETAQRMVAGSWHQLARIALGEGKNAEALDDLRRALAVMDALLQRDPERSLWRRQRSDILGTLARADLAARRLDAALSDARRADEEATALVEAPTDTMFGLRGYLRSILARVYLARGEAAEARRTLEACLEDFDRFAAKEGSVDCEWLPDATEAARSLARLMVRAGQRAEARQLLVRTVGTLDQLSALGHLPGPMRPVLPAARVELNALGPE